MKSKSKYNSICLAKNGTEIPVFIDGKTVDSKYNPEREADRIIESISTDYSFFIVIGIASGVLINKLTEKFNNCKIIGVESSSEDLSFISNLKLIKEIKKNKNIILTDIDSIEDKLINNYIPALYGDLKIIEQRGWIEENKDLIELLNKKLNHAIGIISADFSVQSHFGKIWQNNIMNNLKNICLLKKSEIQNIDKNKIAVIVAAGPTLDQSIKILKENPNQYFIISTDTAYPSLIKSKIIPQIVISIDGQFISLNHFYLKNKETIYFLDLCSNHSISKHLIKNNCNVKFFISGHPLSSFANQNSNFIQLFSGAGTVTITALDLALKLGFSEIKVIGADFSYNKKAYGKGTYFESLYGITQNQIKTLEHKYTNLMYRTPLNKINKDIYTTKILNAYKESFELYLEQNNCNFKKNNSIYVIKNNCNKSVITLNNEYNFNYHQFINQINEANIEDLKFPLLPYIAWLRNHIKNETLKFIDFLKLAQSHIVSYN